MTYKPCKVIAEGCANHQGDLKLAKEMTQMANVCGADYIKWQKRNPIESVPPEWHKKAHPQPEFSYGSTYLEHREALEFSVDQHAELLKFAKMVGIGCAISVWDITSCKQMLELDYDFLKIPSAANLNFDLMNFLVHNYKKDIHLSLGMITKSERNKIVDYVSRYPHRFIIYHTTTEYPCPFSRAFLLQIPELLQKVPRVGFSSHAKGIAIENAAVALGASWIEKHYTNDRTIRSGDAANSLEPEGLRKLVRDLKATYQALQYKPDDMTEVEKEQSDKLRVKV